MKQRVDEVRKLKKIAGLIKEDDFDLSDNPFSVKKRWTGIKRNQCIMYNYFGSEIDGSDDSLRVIDGYAEANAYKYFDEYVQDQLDLIKQEYINDPYTFDRDKFLVSPSNYKIKKLDTDTYEVMAWTPDLYDVSVNLIFIGDDSPLYKKIIENASMVNGVLEFNEDSDEHELNWRISDMIPKETKTLPDYFFDEYFEELKDKLAND